MKILLRFVLILAALQLMHCSYAQKSRAVEQGKEKPTWVDKPYALFPQDRYIVGVGSGDTRDAAEQNAIAEIAKVFQANVQVDETLIESVLEQSKGGKHALQTSSEIYNRSRVTSNQKLKNVKIDRVFFSEDEGLYYALAYLDRAETARMYRKDFEENNLLISEYFEQAAQESNKLRKLANLNRALALWQINDLINEQYKVLTTGSGLVQAVSKSALDEAVSKARKAIVVQLRPQGEVPAEVEQYIKEFIGRLGFTIGQQNADFVLQFSLKLSKTNLNRPSIVAYNWQFTIQWVDAQNGNVLKTLTLNKRTAAISEGEVHARIFRMIKNALMNQFYREILDFVNSF